MQIQAIFVAFCSAVAVSAGECSSSCEVEFVNNCMRFKRNAAESGVQAYNSCMRELNSGTPPMLKNKGCVPNCTPTAKMEESKSNADLTIGNTVGGGSTGPGPPAPGGGGRQQNTAFPRSVAHPDGSTDSTDPTKIKVSATAGVVVLVGDSAFDGKGSTQGKIEEKLSELLQASVVNNAVGGASIDTVYDNQPACSSSEAIINGGGPYASLCTFSVICVGMNPGKDGGKTVQMFVDRELAAGKKVIIVGHPDPKPNDPGSLSRWAKFMDEHATIAAKSSKVWFIDTRTDAIFGHPAQALSDGYYATDNSHPSPTAGEVFAARIASVIQCTADPSEPLDSGGSPTTTSKSDTSSSARIAAPTTTSKSDTSSSARIIATTTSKSDTSLSVSIFAWAFWHIALV